MAETKAVRRIRVIGASGGVQQFIRSYAQKAAKLSEAALVAGHNGLMQVAVLADTHAPRFWKRCPAEVARRLQRVDLILHAGDVCIPAVLDELAEFAPVRVVLGNNDGPDVQAWGAEPTLEFSLAGMAVAMVHDSGPATGRGPRLRRMFPAAALVVFGHSHIPWDVVYQGQRAFNPGSPTDRRRQPVATMGLLHIDDGRIRSAQIVPVSASR